MSKLIFIGITLILVSCSAPTKRVSSKVFKGMDKDDVLSTLGNPSRSKRVKGADRWSYDEYIEGQRQVTYVYFKKGKVSFVGRDDELIKEIKELSQQKKTKSKPKNFRDL